MAKSQKQSGYLVKIEAFVPAELKDMTSFKAILDNTDHAVKTFGPQAVVEHSITPTRR